MSSLAIKRLLTISAAFLLIALVFTLAYDLWDTARTKDALAERQRIEAAITDQRASELERVIEAAQKANKERLFSESDPTCAVPSDHPACH